MYSIILVRKKRMASSNTHRRVEHGLLPEKPSTWRWADLTLKERHQFYNASLEEQIERCRRESEIIFDLDQRGHLTACRCDIPEMAETAILIPMLVDTDHASEIELNAGQVAAGSASDIRKLKSLALRDHTQLAPVKTSLRPTSEDNASDRGGLGTANACVPFNRHEAQAVWNTGGCLVSPASTRSAALSRDGHEASSVVCSTGTFRSALRNSSSGLRPAMPFPFTVNPCLKANSVASTVLVMPAQRA